MVMLLSLLSAMALAVVVGVAAVSNEDNNGARRRGGIKKSTNVVHRPRRTHTPTSMPAPLPTSQPASVDPAVHTSTVDPSVLDSQTFELKSTNIDLCVVDGYSTPYVNLEMVLLRTEAMDNCTSSTTPQQPRAVVTDKNVTVMDCSTAMTRRRRDAMMEEDTCLYGACDEAVSWSWVTYTVTCLDSVSNCTPGILHSNNSCPTTGWKSSLLRSGIFYDAGTATNPSLVELTSESPP